MARRTASVVQTKDGVDQLDSHIDCVGFSQWDKGNTVQSRQYRRSGQMSLGVHIMGHGLEDVATLLKERQSAMELT